MKILVIIFTSFLFSITGIEIATQMENSPKPLDIKSNITLEIKKKKSKVLSFRSIMKDNRGKQIMWFTAPPTDKGISFLKMERNNNTTDMRMWLPAFKKIRRISSKKKGDSFMGSDLSYEDLYTRKITDYTFKLLKEQILKDENCYILESIPIKNLKSDYSKHITWISKSKLIPLKEESFDKKGVLNKEKQFSYIKLNDYWIADKIVVNDTKKGYSTHVKIENIEINSNIKDNIFQEKNLKRLPF
jgi:hypothetical protein